MKDYEKYRWFFTSSEKLVIGGKSSEQNEELMMNIKQKEIVMHTSTPGSPFCIIKDSNANAKDLEETAIFCACFSHDWKKSAKISEIHIFSGSQVIKEEKMKEGTFGIIGKAKKKKVKLQLALVFQKGKLRSVPLSVAKDKIIEIIPGKLNKEEAAKKIMEILEDKGYKVDKNDVLSAIPAKDMEIKQ